MSREDREKRGNHPGWAVRFSDGTWLGGAHGWFRSEDAFYADTYDSEEEAHKYLTYVKNDKDDSEYFALDAEVVPAWEPLCERLRLEVNSLKEVTKIDIFDLNEAVDEVASKVEELKEMVKRK